VTAAFFWRAVFCEAVTGATDCSETIKILAAGLFAAAAQ
jgi:hypothetical protein